MNTQINWEEFFIKEALELEEKMALLDIDSLNQSRTRIALNQGILKWEYYLDWYSQRLPCSYLAIRDDEAFVEGLIKKCLETLNTYSHFNHWGEDLIPLQLWNETLIVFGLQYKEQLSEFDNVVFVLVHPDLLSYVYKSVKELQTDSMLNADNHENSLSNSLSESLLENVDMNITSSKISFSSLTGNVDERTNAEESTGITDIQNVEFWDYLTDRHDEYTFEAKKQFDAYLVLKINQGKTKIFKTDPELEKLGLKSSDFIFNIKEDNPFHQVFYSESSIVLNVSQVQKDFKFNLSPFKFMCVSALKRGTDVLGFLVGLKKSNLSEKDETLLNDLAKESA